MGSQDCHQNLRDQKSLITVEIFHLHFLLIDRTLKAK